MTNVIESDDYRKTREALKADPIIQAMAAEIQQKFNLSAALAAFTHNGTARGTDGGDGPTFEFMTRALDEYHRRGGTVGSHIGGPAEAILMILKGGMMPREMTQCDKCGDTSNSAPNLPCGRVDRVGDEPCTGTYRELKTFVITASVYVDSVATPELAAEQVRRSNEGMGMERYGIEIRLSDEDSGYEWSEVGEPEDDDLPGPGPGMMSMALDPKYNKGR